MKVLLTADAVGGVWTYAMDLTRELTRDGHEVVVATMGPRPDAAQRREASHVTLAESEHRLEWMRDPWRDVDRAGEWLLDLEREHAPDVVHLNGYAHAALPWRAPRMVVAHSCVLTWWRAVHGCDAPGTEWSEYRRRVAGGLAAADLVVAPTRALLDEMRALYGFASPALVIPNGRAAPAGPSARKEPFVLAVGRAWDEAKGIATLDAAAADLPWRVRVAGDTQSPDGVQARPLRHAEALGRLAPEALRDAYSRAAILAHPAKYEPFGLSPLEAALAGCALVLSDLPTLREVWGDAALYAPAGDPVAWREALGDLIADDARRARLAAASTGRARHHTPAAMAAAYAEAYSRLTRSSTPEAPPCAS